MGDTINFTDEHPTIVAQLTQLTEDARRQLGYRDQIGAGQLDRFTAQNACDCHNPRQFSSIVIFTTAGLNRTRPDTMEAFTNSTSKSNH